MEHVNAPWSQLHTAKVEYGTDAAKGAPRGDGDVYYAHDTGALYIGQGGAWIAVGGGAGTDALDDLSDVDTSGKADGDLLGWNAGAGQWQAITPVAALTDLTDIDIASPEDGHALLHAGGLWENRRVSFYDLSHTQGATPSVGAVVAWVSDDWTVGQLDLAHIGDVDLTGLSDDDVLQYDLASGLWRPAAGGGGGVAALNDLNDVALAVPAQDEEMRYDAASGQWQNAHTDGFTDLMLIENGSGGFDILCDEDGNPMYAL